MTTQTVEKTAVIARDGTPLSVMERPEGLGSFADYHHFAPLGEVWKTDAGADGGGAPAL